MSDARDQEGDRPAPQSTTALPAQLRGAELPGADLRRRDLSGADLAGANLEGADLEEANLERASLAGARLQGATLTGAVAHGAGMQGADLRRVKAAGLRARELDLEDAQLGGADLSGAQLAGALLLGAKLHGASLRGAVLREAELREADLSEADLSGADLSGADLRGAKLSQTRLESARLQGARLAGATGLSTEEIDALVAAGASAGLGLQPLRRVVSGVAGLWTGARRSAQRAGRRLGLGRQRAVAAGRAFAASVGGPGADLRGRDLKGENLAGAAWREVDLREANLEEARLDSADLKRAQLDGARMEAARLRRAALAGARLRGAVLIDADLREADLTGADLSEADLTGADLRGATLHGATFEAAKLRASRLCDLSLDGVRLDRADLDQADASGVDWAGASVSGAELAGALGLSDGEREALGARGAKTGADAFAGVSARWARAAVGLLALGMGVYLAARFLAPGSVETEALESAAEALRDQDPLAASAAYEELAKAAARPEDQVSQRLEAASLSQRGGDVAGAERLLKDALSAAGEDPALSSRVRLRLGDLLGEQQRWAEVLETITPLFDPALSALEGQPTAERARALVLYDDAQRKGGGAGEPVDARISGLAMLPETEAELRVAMAELRANRDQNEEALAQLDRLQDLTLPDEAALRVLETRARVLDRVGRTREAIAAWEALREKAPADSLSSQAARLSLADLYRREGRGEDALALLEPLLAEEADARMRGRALLLHGGLLEDKGKVEEAISDYRAAVAAPGLDSDTVEEARLSLARLLLADGGEAAAVLATLPPETAAAMLAQARLGEARRLLDGGDVDAASTLFTEIARSAEAARQAGAAGAVDASVLRAARSGEAEVKLARGQAAEAIQIWTTLLAESPPPEERAPMSLLLAGALLGRGERERARSLFTELSAEGDEDARAAGLLGLAEVARASGEREEAKRRYQTVAELKDPAWRVRALQELAEMAAEEGRPEAALEAWRRLIASLPPGSNVAFDAWMSLIGALEDSKRPAEAAAACARAVAAVAGEDRDATRLACAELAWRQGDEAAASKALARLARDPSVSAEVAADAAAAEAQHALRAAARDPAAAAEVVSAAEAGLARAERPALRVPLLALKAQGLRLRGDAEGAHAVEVELDGLAAAAPEAAAAWYAEAATWQRGQGDGAAAAAFLRRALALPVAPLTAAGLGAELGEVLLGEGDLKAAEAAFRDAGARAPAGSEEAFRVGLGLAELKRRGGDAAGAVAQLRALSAPDEASRARLQEALAAALGAAGDPAAAAAWEALASSAGADPETRATALRGQATAAQAQGDATTALALYRQAAEAAPASGQVGWARLGEAEALAALGQATEADAALAALSADADPEVALQARTRRARLRITQQDWQGALDALGDPPPASLGPAWDATWTEAAAAALSGAGRPGEAERAWLDLTERWRGQEEAELPAFMGLAWMALQQGDREAARRWAKRAADAARDPGYQKLAKELLAAVGA